MAANRFDCAVHGLCQACAGKSFWSNLLGLPVCRRCHPPAPGVQVAIRIRHEAEAAAPEWLQQLKTTDPQRYRLELTRWLHVTGRAA